VRTKGIAIFKDEPNTVAYQTVEGADSFTIVTGQLAFEVTKVDTLPNNTLQINQEINIIKNLTPWISSIC
jgi:hypothetical protein